MGKNNMTAVEWLVNELRSYTFHHTTDMSDWRALDKMHKKAKKMELEQLIQAYKSDRYPCSNEDAEQYYNETYGK